MRLHRLTVSAFGPFPGTEEVDFDALNEAGLFLLTGPTGAGKSSLLDAICFALYGQVPGVRGVKTLKSQHAADDVRPEVVLDFSVRGRRFVVRRSPEWHRPKHRGVGLARENASATLVERLDSGEHFLSSRAQEVGHLLSELLGMHAAQFQQVAMLPQGEFQRFLQATSQERHDVLQRLFRTDRFTRIEDWVQDRSRGLRRHSAEGQARVQRVLAAMADRSGVDLPEAVDVAEPSPSAFDDEVLLPWAASLVDDAARRLAELRTVHAAATERLRASRVAHETASRTAAGVARRDEALRVLAALDADEAGERSTRARLDADRRAQRCEPVLALLDEESRRRADAAAGLRNALEGLPDETASELELGRPETQTPPTAEQVDAVEYRLREELALATSLLPRETELRGRHEALRAAERDLEARQTVVEVHARRLAEAPARRTALARELEVATATAHRTDALVAELALARDQLDAARALPALERDLEALRAREREARDAAADARERMLDTVAARLAGMAGELAAGLQDDQPCQVCGSTVHPRPAAAASNAVSKSDQEHAAAVFDRRAAELAALSEQRAETERSLDGVRRDGGQMTEPEAVSRVATLEAALADAGRARLAVTRVAEQVATLERESAEQAARLRVLEAEVAVLGETLKGHHEAIERLSDEVEGIVGGPPQPGALRAHVTARRAALDAVKRVAEALTGAAAAEQRHQAVETRAIAAVQEHGLTSAAHARAALLDEEDRSRAEETLASRAGDRVRAQLVLDDPDVRRLEGLAASDLRATDLAATGRAHDEATALESETARAVHLHEQTVAHLTSQLSALREALRVWAPARADFTRADQMAQLVRGLGSDNHLQMRLSSYVLAHRLDQVIEAANERLAHLRDQRYLLQRTGRAARRGSQAGLGLQVLDEWTGDVRDPATLSGGETFVVSLSLALGLADVVTQEAGGAELETLFVDEGFGMLDADTLDDVMDRLDGLRAGGRTVGVVSHVTEIRTRIPTQVHVDKQRTGSTVAVRVMVT